MPSIVSANEIAVEQSDVLPADRFADVSFDRRTFLKAAAAPCMIALVGAALRERSFALPTPAAGEDDRFVREARFYEKLPGNLVRCKLCPRQCEVPEGERGYCRVRENRKGKYFTLVHSRVVAAHVDPIEKKPFFHFLPGAMAFSIATGGCNVNCKFCQNWEISQARPEQLRGLYLPPDDLADNARRSQCGVLAYTYSEPVVFSEYVIDAAKTGRRAGLKSVVVSNGFIQREPLHAMCDAVDAIKIDLKSYSEKYYHEVVRGELRPVLDSIVNVRKSGRWLEIVYLVVPTLNDSDAEFRGVSQWIKKEVGADVPIHFTRFRPLYLLTNLPPTPLATLERAKSIADAEGLQYAYVGNVPGHPGENTYCPGCRKLLIERMGFTATQVNLDKGKCRYCKRAIPGVWST
ncbi:MAG: AmmeMemoRadiSam system radical SAM enzyme [Acidobacteriia bacterium]|nr:AmmeMemoRadiSam system radical SAM enzyme [Terriglobia bacterium]